ncbi:MAG TPA: hypothetical protein VNZ25_01485 [Candidatus Angelobacter sp.]|nr:hypothetical protein [Candidatus Angelobacter sp.]
MALATLAPFFRMPGLAVISMVDSISTDVPACDMGDRGWTSLGVLN